MYSGQNICVFVTSCLACGTQNVSHVTSRFSGLDDDDDDNDDSWGPLVLMGMTALNATVGLTRSTADPFSPTEVPLISVLPPTPDATPKNSDFQWDDGDMICPPVGLTAPSGAASQVSTLGEVWHVMCCCKRIARFALRLRICLD